MRSVTGPSILALTSLLLAGCATAPAEPSAPAAPAARPHANLAQLMRGIPFTFSNIVFDAQSTDPGAPRTPNEGGVGATAQFKSVYGGWQEVENSSLALAETANLIMVPGRVCENGLPVPIDRADFQQAAEGLRTAGMQAYEAAKEKNLDKMLDIAGTVSEACSNCHEPYRDFDDPAMKCGGKAAE